MSLGRINRTLIPVLMMLVSSLPIVNAIPNVRIKDIANIGGTRTNQLLGTGIVTGLSGRGDSPSSNLLKNTVANLLSHFGVEVSPNDISSRNCAIVMVSINLPAFARPGDRVDLTVSSIGDARSLDGGILLQTNVQAANGQVYAVAQGRIVASSADDNAKTVGRIPGGAIVEKEVRSEYATAGVIPIVLRNPDFVTSNAVVKAITGAFKDIKVTSRDAALIEVTLPTDRAADPVSFLSELEQLTVTPDIPGKVVVDSSSGIVIVGEKVKIGKVLVSYRKMTIKVASFNSNPDDKPDSFVIPDTTTVEDFVKVLTDAGLKSDAIIGILQAIEKAGALFGELVVM